MIVEIFEYIPRYILLETVEDEPDGNLAATQPWTWNFPLPRPHPTFPAIPHIGKIPTLSYLYLYIIWDICVASVTATKFLLFWRWWIHWKGKNLNLIQVLFTRQQLKEHNEDWHLTIQFPVNSCFSQLMHFRSTQAAAVSSQHNWSECKNITRCWQSHVWPGSGSR